MLKRNFRKITIVLLLLAGLVNLLILFCFKPADVFTEPSLRTYTEACAEYYREDAEIPSINRTCHEILDSNKVGGEWRDSKQDFDAGKDFMDLRRTLLVIIYNLPYYTNAAKNYALYHRIFGQVTFCGPDDSEADFWPIWETTRENNSYVSLPENVTFLPYGARIVNSPGDRAYTCYNAVFRSSLAVELEERFDSILISSDDAILNVWTWKRNGKRLDKAWALNVVPAGRPYSYTHIYSADTGGGCVRNTGDNSIDCEAKAEWYYSVHNIKQMTAFHNQMDALAASDSFWRDAQQKIANETGGPRRLIFGGYDVFHIPKKHWYTYGKVLQLCDKLDVYGDLAVGVAMCVIPYKDRLELDKQRYDYWTGFRHLPAIETYNADAELYHPFKMSALFSEKHQGFTFDEKSRAEGTNAYRGIKGDTSIACVFCYVLEIINKYADMYEQITAPTATVPSYPNSDCYTNDCFGWEMWSEVAASMSIGPSSNCTVLKGFGNGDRSDGLPHHICLDDNIKPQSNKCRVWTITRSVASDTIESWSFEREFLSLYGCSVLAMGVIPNALNESMYFQIDYKPIHMKSGLPFLAENEVVDVLKLDMEGQEVELLRQMIESGFLSKHIRQLTMEWHLFQVERGKIARQDFITSTYRKLREETKFNCFYSHIAHNDYGFFLKESYINQSFL